ncbi:MAG TPA: HEAT repeat domain-containing protein [Longimicrobium sp.]|nr:HEAT repeat domain-containing protein [Longimicrobium sp.]
MSETVMRAAAWLLTYAMHSTLLLAAAALLARRVRGEAWRETLWKAALVGGLVTATAQTQSGYDPAFGTVWLGRTVEPVPSIATPLPIDQSKPSPAVETPAEAAPGASTSASASSSRSAGASASTASSSAAPADPPVSAASTSIDRRRTVELAVTAWALIAMLLLVRVAWRQTRLWHMLRGRTDVTDEAMRGMVAGLRRNAGLWRPIRLTACAATPTPLALGGGEVCLPPRFLTDLDPEQQRSALAHELAHLARRDPAWHFAVGVIQAVFFFQPLNRLARLRLRESAEFLCDEWAARQTGSPLGLARCLAEVASWVAPGRTPIPAGTMAMAEGGSPLVQRVQRLTTWRGGSHQASVAVRAAGAVLLVLVVALAAPSVASTAGRRHPAPDPARTEAVREGAMQAVVQDGIIRHPQPSEPLARRWEWAVEEIARRRLNRAYVTYSIPTTLELGDGWSTDSHGVNLSELDGAAVNHVVGAPLEDVVIIFLVARDGEVERVAARAAVEFEFGRVPVVWLGRAEGDESFAHLRRLADRQRNPDLRETLVGAIGVHRGDATVPYLAAVLGRDGSNGVRQEAAGALAHHRTDEALTALTTAVERDGSEDVRHEAVEAIGWMRHPRSVALLREIVASRHDAETRRTAVEALGESGGDAFESLRQIALREKDQEVARQAVESMEGYPPEQAVAVLEQVAWLPDRADVSRQAAESLGRFPAPWAVEPLDSIARTHPDTEVAQQAVESLGKIPGGAPDGYLIDLSRTHPDEGVREEALDALARRRGAESGDEIDPDPDFEIDFGSPNQRE